MNITNTKDLFERRYRSQDPDGTTVAVAGWDIGGPQPALVDLEKAGAISGAVLDIGCGTGDNALYLAQRGYSVTGLDRAPSAIAHARVKAAQRNLDVTFAVANVLELEPYRDGFDVIVNSGPFHNTVDSRVYQTIVDSGLFHTFSDADQVRYLAALRAVSRSDARLYILAVSDEAVGEYGPRRLTEVEMRAPFTDDWFLEDLRPVTMVGALAPDAPQRSDNPAWLVTARRR